MDFTLIVMRNHFKTQFSPHVATISLQPHSLRKDIFQLRAIARRFAVAKQLVHVQIARTQTQKRNQRAIARYCAFSVEDVGKTNQRLDMDIILHNLHALLTALKKENKTMANEDKH